MAVVDGGVSNAYKVSNLSPDSTICNKGKGEVPLLSLTEHQATKEY
jgi:hypothetical protein